MATIQDYLAYLNRPEKRPIYKVELLRKENEEPYTSITGDLENNSGSLNISFSEGVRRTCGFTLQNFDLQYIPLIKDINIASKFKLYLGFNIDGEDFFPQAQGVFFFDDPALTSANASRTVSISGTDKFSGLNGGNGGNLEASYFAPLGTKVSTLVRSVLALDIVKDPIEPIIDESLENLTLPYDLTKETGETVSSILFDAAFAISAYVYYDENGALNLRPLKQDNQKGVVYSYAYDNVNYLGSSKRIGLGELYNATVLIADNIQNSSVPIYYEAVNNDPSDINSVINSKKKVKKIVDFVKGITTSEQAEIRGEWELRRVSALGSSLSINSVPFYHLDVNQVVTVGDPYIDSDFERSLINGISIPIGTGGTMTIDVIKTIE
jgi:hypothetical protein